MNFLNNIKNNIKKYNLNNLIDEYDFFTNIKNYHFNYFKKNLNKYQYLFDLLSLENEEIKIDKTYRWNQFNNKYPIIYYFYKNKYNNYTEFEKYYHINKFAHQINFKIKNYISNLHNDIEEILNDIINTGYFIPLDIKYIIENKINQSNRYVFNNFIFYYFYDDKVNIQLIKYINIIVNWLLKIKKSKYELIKIIYFDININKNYLNDEFISTNINSGYSYSNFIVIVRKEENLKVLIHELIHVLEIDIKYSLDELDYKIGKFNYKILTRETLAEIMAQFLYCIFFSTIAKIKEINKYNLFINIYFYENLYNWLQFKNIFNFYKISNYDKSQIINNFHQLSNVYAYYINKPIFLIYNYQLIDILLSENKKKLDNNLLNQYNKDFKNYIDKLILKKFNIDMSLSMCFISQINIY